MLTGFLADLIGLIIKHAPELLLGAVGYNIRKFFGEYLSRYIFSPIFRTLYRFTLRPFKNWLRNRIIKTEQDAAIFLHNRNKALRKYES
jgi:hypothetical protein